MKRITILCVGKLRERYWEEACAEYAKRLAPYCDLRTVEVKQADKLLARVPENDFVVALDIGGKALDSPQFADYVRMHQEEGRGLSFLIGGAEGLGSEVTGQADERISLSAMTFPHQVARLLLLEQIYRGYRIRNGEPYHK